MELYDKLTAKYPFHHFSTSTTQTVIDEDDPNAITSRVTFEHTGIEVLKIDRTLFVFVRDTTSASSVGKKLVEVCDGAIATEVPSRFIGYVEMKSRCTQNVVVKARSQLIASYYHMLSIAQDCGFSISNFQQKGIIVSQPITDEVLIKACQRRKRDDDLNHQTSSARFLLKLIEGKAKDEKTGICFIHAVPTDVVDLRTL